MSKTAGVLWIVAYVIWMVAAYIISFLFGKKLGAATLALF